MVRAPATFASCAATLPVAPVAPLTSAVSPRRGGRATACTPTQAVMPLVIPRMPRKAVGGTPGSEIIGISIAACSALSLATVHAPSLHEHSRVKTRQ